ncbi:CbrC family protein [Sporichthya polymorpha]|uniref:CbrC family protein n=1 Tax=Sporichthya polymorpha TaxID=35751 RepID=UPI0024807587|nr:CbrC family protein [Sporichthya polymorpha]
MSELPVFRYHPDPVGTGSIEATEDTCEFCDLPRGWRYTANIYAEEEFETVCPWCIADGPSPCTTHP